MKIEYKQTVTRGIVDALYWVPLEEVRAHRVRELFTVKKSSMEFKTKQWVTTHIPTWRMGTGDKQGLIGLPIYAGMEMFPAQELVENLSDGREFSSWTRLPDPNHPSAAPGQEQFMAEVAESTDDYYTTLIRADTGCGKTVVSLGEAARLRRTTLILVPLDRLMLQWKKQIIDVLGVPADKVGIVQGAKCQWGRDIVVGMMHSVARREYPPEFYTAFGTLIVDEVHNTGAEMLSQCLGLFNARNKMALTATDDRRDGGDSIYYQHFGYPTVQAKMRGVPTEVLTVPLHGDPGLTSDDRHGRLDIIARDHERNHLIANITAAWYEEGQHILLIMEHVDHAYHVQKYLKASGIPDNQIGLYLGQQRTKGRGREDTSKEYLDWVEKVPAVVIATYGMMKEGIDIPRLGRGIDCSPISDLRQTLGRIRRRYAGKEVARWVTFRDRTIPAFEQSYMDRIRSIRDLDNVTVIPATKETILDCI